MKNAVSVGLAALLSASVAGIALAQTNDVPGRDTDTFGTDAQVETVIEEPAIADDTATESEPGRDTDTAGTEQGGGVLPAASADADAAVDAEPGRDTDTAQVDGEVEVEGSADVAAPAAGAAVDTVTTADT
jgi:hypothetical protein